MRARLSPDADGWAGVLHGDEDTPRAWLRAGEALAAMVLTANRHGLAVVANRADPSDPGARALLDDVAQPYLTLHVTRAAR